MHGDSLHTILRASVVAVGLAVEAGAAPDAEDRPNPHTCSAAARRGAAAGKQLVVGVRVDEIGRASRVEVSRRIAC